MEWHLTADLAILKLRSQLLNQVRTYFLKQGLIEVDPPCLSQAGVNDLHLDSLITQVQRQGQQVDYYLHTSPEYAMKRLLATGLGDCFYLGKVWRDNDEGSRHQVEFTMLEWYRNEIDFFTLMDEVAEFVSDLLGLEKSVYLTYQAAFARYAEIEDVHHASAAQLKACLDQKGISIAGVDLEDKTLWEQLVFTEIVEPCLGEAKEIVLLYDFPAKAAALAEIDAEAPWIAKRFEVYVQGVELANGYQELRQGDDYLARFQGQCEQRIKAGKNCLPIDSRLVLALTESPLPLCSGVALGFDRLLMLLAGKKHIQDVICWGLDRA